MKCINVNATAEGLFFLKKCKQGNKKQRATPPLKEKKNQETVRKSLLRNKIHDFNMCFDAVKFPSPVLYNLQEPKLQPRDTSKPRPSQGDCAGKNEG